MKISITLNKPDLPRPPLITIIPKCWLYIGNRDQQSNRVIFHGIVPGKHVRNQKMTWMQLQSPLKHVLITK
jgi:hypothetical protein